ncbi:Calmodulin-binding transcription activator 2 [Acorus calamus]|uniref:Calmodulin-binding transcription activator 2 n=1 Tax=Acorus calamus TaxID=4465 RepID=A0AAV9F0N6_ACOCL|nr:Calmodulin-binding transcription activator 2 [Acorus calamus]
MAENKIHGCPPQLDLQQILQEVHTRWLRASEICHILRNYQKFYVKPEPPCRPPGGSLFLFDRKALRYFRKDGHRWRKKKDGKTVREAHEKLKSGSKDVLHCYYAHGEDNENFQRRSYWLLDPELDHIVLVHYREVEGNRPGASHSLNTDPVITNYFEDPCTNSATCSIPVQSSGRGIQASSPSTIDWNGHVPSSEFEDGDSGDDYGASSVAQPVSSSRIQISSHENGLAEGIFQGYRGIMPFPSSSGLMNSTVIGNVSFSPLYVNQAVPSNIKLSTDQTINHRTSQE